MCTRCTIGPLLLTPPPALPCLLSRPARSSALGSGVADPALVAAALVAAQSLQTMLAGLTDALALAQAAFVGVDGLDLALEALILGTMTPADFAASTTVAALLAAAAQTPVPGQLVPNACSGSETPMWLSM